MLLLVVTKPVESIIKKLREVCYLNNLEISNIFLELSENFFLKIDPFRQAYCWDIMDEFNPSCPVDTV